MQKQKSNEQDEQNKGLFLTLERISEKLEILKDFHMNHVQLSAT